MKKKIALLLALLMVWGSFAVSAGTTEDFLEVVAKAQNLRSMTFSADITPSIEELPTIFGEETTEMIPLLNSMSAMMDCALYVEEWGNFQAYVAVTISTPFGDAPVTECWVDLDLLSEEPTYKMIMADPAEEGRYVYADFTESEFFDAVALDALFANKEASFEEMAKIYADIAKITKTGNTYSVEISAEDIKGYITPAWENVTEILPTENIDELAQIGSIFESIADIKLFGEPAYTETYTVNADNTLSAQTAQICIDTKLSDWAEAFGITEEDSGLNATNSALKGSVNLSVYDILYDCDEIPFPVLTPENSTNFLSSVYSENKINVYVDGVPLVFDVEPIQMYDTTLVPIRRFCNAIGVSDEDITYSNADGVEIVEIKMADKEIILTVDSMIATVNGEERELIAPAIIKNDRTLVPLRFISETFDMDVIWTPFFYEGTDVVSGCIIDINHK